MNRRTGQIGFNQRIYLEWLERTANLVLAGNNQSTINDVLQDFLKDKVSVGGNAERGSREKIITILMKVWFNVPKEIETLRNDALTLLKRLPSNEHMIIHWGMTISIYPFWAVVADHVGRLLKLQGSIASSQILRRVREQYGERETVYKATQRIVRSFVDWNVLQEAEKKGAFSQGATLAISDPNIIAWLVEACLYTYPNLSAPISEILNSSALFPFRLKYFPADYLANLSGRMDVLRHGMDQDLIMIK